MAGYTRQSIATIVTGADILALPLNNEFNAIQAAFHGTTGHTHDGSSGNGPLISLLNAVTGVLPVARGGFAGIHKLNATVEPTINDDSADGYVVGSHWVDTVSDKIYTAVDVTPGAAVWLAQQDYDLGLQTLALFNTNGFVVQTSNDNWAGRTITGTANQIGVTNGNGVSGNPVLTVLGNLPTLATYNTNGIFTQTASGTYTGRTITGTANQITITNGNGVSGNPTISIPSTLIVSTQVTSGRFSVDSANPEIEFIDQTNNNRTLLSNNQTDGTFTISVDSGNTGSFPSLDINIGGNTNAFVLSENGNLQIGGTIPQLSLVDTATGTSYGMSTDGTTGSLTINADEPNLVANSVLNLNVDNTNVASFSTTSMTLPQGRITFPATENASTDPNTLDDYEEGTYTPTVIGSTAAGVGTYSVQSGRYTKIGRVIYFECTMTWSAHTGTGNMRFSLPFNAAASPVSPLSIVVSGITFTGIPCAQTRTSVAQGEVFVQATGAGIAALAMDTAGQFNISGWYTAG